MQPGDSTRLKASVPRAFEKGLRVGVVNSMSLCDDPVVPDWMRVDPAGQTADRPCAGSGKRLSGFTQDAIHSLLALLQEALFQERVARVEGLLQSLDPRAKLLGALVLLGAASFLRDVWLLAVFHLGLLLLAVACRFNGFLFLKRVWLFVPLFSAIMALPATVNWVTPGHSLWTLHEFDSEIRLGKTTLPASLAITDAGVMAAGRFVMRVAVSISIAVLLVLTTPWQQLLRALRVVGVPHFFVFALGMSYRYIHLLLRLLLDLHLGRRSRTLRRARWRQDQAWMASRAAYLFQRSQALGENVYRAMLSRGFHGEPKLLDDLRWQLKDGAAVSVAIALSIAMLLADR